MLFLPLRPNPLVLVSWLSYSLRLLLSWIVDPSLPLLPSSISSIAEHTVIITTLVVTLQGEPKMKSNKIYEPKMQTTKKITNQGEDDCSMLGLEPRHRRRNRKTELVPNPQSSNRPVCDFNVQISIFVLMEDRQDVSFYIYIYIYIYLCACFYFACMCFLCCFAVWWMRKLGKANLKLVC